MPAVAQGPRAGSGWYRRTACRQSGASPARSVSPPNAVQMECCRSANGCLPCAARSGVRLESRSGQRHGYRSKHRDQLAGPSGAGHRRGARPGRGVCPRPGWRRRAGGDQRRLARTRTGPGAGTGRHGALRADGFVGPRVHWRGRRRSRPGHGRAGWPDQQCGHYQLRRQDHGAAGRRHLGPGDERQCAWHLAGHCCGTAAPGGIGQRARRECGVRHRFVGRSTVDGLHRQQGCRDRHDTRHGTRNGSPRDHRQCHRAWPGAGRVDRIRARGPAPGLPAGPGDSPRAGSARRHRRRAVPADPRQRLHHWATAAGQRWFCHARGARK